MDHFLDIESLDDSTIGQLLERSAGLIGGQRPRALDGSIANLFCEPSTRTRVSFELAARAAGLDVVNIDLQNSSATKGESLDDTARTLAAMGIAAIVLRHPRDRAAAELACALDGGPCPVRIINAGDGIHAHPSQALLDAATLEQAGVDWHRLRVAIVGDIRHSRVARSDVALFARLGAAEIRIAGPEEFLPPAGQMPAAIRFDRLDPALDGVDAVICLRIQRERISADFPQPDAYHQRWGVNVERLARLAPKAHVLHPGPVNRNIEIADAVVDGPQSLILDQVRNGVHARTALFEHLLAGPKPGRPVWSRTTSRRNAE